MIQLRLDFSGTGHCLYYVFSKQFPITLSHAMHGDFYRAFGEFKLFAEFGVGVPITAGSQARVESFEKWGTVAPGILCAELGHYGFQQRQRPLTIEREIRRGSVNRFDAETGFGVGLIDRKNIETYQQEVRREPTVEEQLAAELAIHGKLGASAKRTGNP